MQDILNLVFEQLRNVWRFRWLALGAAWAIAIVGWLYVYSMPDIYQSEARVNIDTESAIHPLLSGMAVTPNVNQQVRLLIQTVLSRPNLASIARQTGLDLSASTPEQTQALLDNLAQQISLRAVGAKTDLYRIRFSSEDPKMAQAVVQEVMNVMTTMSVGDQARSEDSEQATAFLEREVEKYQQRLVGIERDLANFKKNNPDLIPGTGDYVSQVRGTRASVDSLKDQLAAARQRLASLQSQRAGSGGSASVDPLQSQQILGIDRQIEQREQQLPILLGKYTDQHPDVLTARRDIERLQGQRAQTLAELRANPGLARSAMSGDGGRAAIGQQISEASGQVASLQSSIRRQEAALGDLESGADDMTDAQAQLAELTRNYQVNQDQYQKLLTRLYSARLSNDVRASNDPLQFRVIDPAELPAEPSGPQRTVLLTVALLAAIVAGVALAFFFSQIRPVFISRKALTDATGLPVLGSVSTAWTTTQRARRHSALLLFGVCAATLFVGYLGAVAFAPIGAEMVPNFMSGQSL